MHLPTINSFVRSKQSRLLGALLQSYRQLLVRALSVPMRGRGMQPASPQVCIFVTITTNDDDDDDDDDDELELEAPLETQQSQ